MYSDKKKKKKKCTRKKCFFKSLIWVVVSNFPFHLVVNVTFSANSSLYCVIKVCLLVLESNMLFKMWYKSDKFQISLEQFYFSLKPMC